MIQLREQRRRADFDMKTALSKNDIDLNVVDRLKKDIVDVESKLIDNRVNSVVSLKKVLSATQFDKFLDLQIRRHSGPMNEMKGDKMPLARKKAIK